MQKKAKAKRTCKTWLEAEPGKFRRFATHSARHSAHGLSTEASRSQLMDPSFFGFFSFLKKYIIK